MARPARKLFRRAADKMAAPYVHELSTRIAELSAEVRALTVERSDIELRELHRMQLMLRDLDEDATGNRRGLYALRESEEYELAFAEPEPLVTFIVPTHTRFESLRDVSLPSILAQTYTNFEVIVSGDCSPPETERVVAEFGDSRVRFINRSVRGPYPEDETTRWYMIGTPPFNDALALARGRWIAALGDDDAVVPEHAEVLLRAARDRRYEHCYGRYRVNYPSGEVLEIGSFPPKRGEYILQTALYHAGLRFFQLSSSDPLYFEPNDWSLCRRMLNAGVRFGMVEEFLADKYESRYHSHSDWGVHGIPTVE